METISEFGKDYLPSWCLDCDREGYIFVDNPEGTYFVTCKSCGWETSEVSCPICRTGGEFVNNIDQRPPSWICPECKTEHRLPKEFYEKSIHLYTDQELPLLVRERIEREIRANQPSFIEEIWQTIKIVLTLFAIMALGLLPMALVYTPLPWTIPGFIATMIAFVVWWWLIGKGIKITRARSAKE